MTRAAHDRQPAARVKPPGDSALTVEQLAALREQLEARARQLGAEVRQVGEDFAGAPAQTLGVVGDEGDQGAVRTHDLIRHAEQDRDADELARIDAALTRMDEGRYGICIECEVDIPLARLQAQPSAARCIACQSGYEKLHPPELRETLPR